MHQQMRQMEEDQREPNGVDWKTLLNFIRDLERTRDAAICDH